MGVVLLDLNAVVVARTWDLREKNFNGYSC